MSKWTPNRRDPARTYIDENKIRVRSEIRLMLSRFIEEGIDAEPKYAAALKLWFPAITPEQMRAKIMRFRDAVAEKRQERGLVP
jgi:hypothetical protein